MDKRNDASFAELRKRAEKASNKRKGRGGKLSNTDLLHLIQEIEVRQIELDLQNKELRQSQKEIEARRMWAEEALCESENRYRSLFESINEGFCIIQVIFDENGRGVDHRFLETNPAFERHTGLVNAVGKTARELVPDLEDRWPETYGRIAKTGVPERFVDESAAMGRWFEVDCFRIGDPEERKVALLFNDITEPKRSAERLRELNETLEQRITERTELAETRARQLARLTSELTLAEEHERRRLADILHEHLQQLLVGIRLNLDSLSDHVASDKKPTLDTAIQLLSDTIQTSRSITAELSPPILYQNGLAAGLEWLSRRKQEKYGFSVELQVEPEVISLQEDITVVLFRSVRELLLNAIKHSGVDSAKVILSKDGSDRLRIVVSDSGKGFDPGRIWESSEQQSGFGLFTIRERLEFLGGRFEIESAPGKGASFTLVAPVENKGTVEESVVFPDAAPQQAPDKKSQKIRTLLVDDHAVVRQGLAMILDSQKDIEVAGEAADGEEAVKLAKKKKPDVILMDISLPGINGIEATRRIHSELPQIRIICLSMFEDHEMASSALQSGAAEYLSKSGDTDVLLSAIRGEGKRKSERNFV